MKAESDIKPIGLYTVEKSGHMADVRFYENVVEVEVDGTTRYEYETFLLTTEYTDELIGDLAANAQTWLEKAKEKNVPVYQPKTTEERVEVTEVKVINLEQEIDVLFGGAN